jgi:hypothetical protein
MSHHDPIDGSARRRPAPGQGLRPDVMGPLQIPPMEVRNIGPGSEEVAARVNALHGAATLAWCLVLWGLAAGIPVIVLLWRIAF